MKQLAVGEQRLIVNCRRGSVRLDAGTRRRGAEDGLKCREILPGGGGGDQGGPEGGGVADGETFDRGLENVRD